MSTVHPPPTPRALSFPSRRLQRLSSCPTAPSQLRSPLCISLTQTEPFLRLPLGSRILLPYSLPSGMSPFSRSSPEDICTLLGHSLEFCIVSQNLLLSLLHSQHPSLLPSPCLPRPSSCSTALSWLCSALCALLPPSEPFLRPSFISRTLLLSSVLARIPLFSL